MELSDAASCSVWSGSILFANKNFYAKKKKPPESPKTKNGFIQIMTDKSTGHKGLKCMVTQLWFPTSFFFFFNPTALRRAKTLWSFDPSECNRVKRGKTLIYWTHVDSKPLDRAKWDKMGIKIKLHILSTDWDQLWQCITYLESSLSIILREKADFMTSRLLPCTTKSSKMIYSLKERICSLNPFHTENPKGIGQKVQTQIRCHIMWHLIWVFTILQVVQPFFNKNILTPLKLKMDSFNI